MYLSTKHISFAKGLARKLIPKYIGPYKITQDFENSSFRIELPANLKRRGVHDVFHSSLLQEHIPNDDQLFPGRLDAHLGNTPETEGEWAVDRILSHAGASTDSVFEIKWKSGDITWLPYYQITHLQALDDYLDLFGKSKIKKLPKGTGSPPQDDPQIFLGDLSFVPHPVPSPTTSELDSYKKPRYFATPNHPLFVDPHSRSPTFVANPMSFIKNRRFCAPPRQQYPGVKHPLFTRISPTVYLIKDHGYAINTTVHITQIAEYIQFDEELCTYGSKSDFNSFPC